MRAADKSNTSERRARSDAPYQFMNTRLLKEFRQLLPAWCVAMLLAAFPTRIFEPHDQPEFKITAYIVGLLCLAVSSFGREFGHRTFPVFLSQPLPRVQLWREKTGTLFVATVAVCLVFLLSTTTRLNSDRLIQWVGLILAPVALAGGLWMTLAFRQIVIAFFFTFVIPTIISSLVQGASDLWLRDWMLPLWGLAMLIYATLAFWFARRLFLDAQDYHWTGGEIAFDFKFLGRKSQAGSVPTRQSPVWALVKKEILFHQSSLICALVVAGVTAIGLMLGKLTGALLPTATGSSEFFAAFAIGFPMMGCLVLPLLTGALSIAEERRLGTLDAQQSLPMSRWRQFVVKGAATFALSIALGAVLTWLLIEAGQAVLGNRGVPSSDHPPFGFLLGAAMVMTTLAFYASSLTRSTIHAVVLAVVLVVIPLGVILASFPYVVRQRMGFAQGGEALLWLIGLPVGLAVLVRLSFTNYCARVEGRRLAWHNVRVWLLSALAVCAVSTAVYHRCWELLITGEAPHGAPQSSLAAPPKLLAAGNRIVVLLADGRIWMRKLESQTLKLESQTLVPLPFRKYSVSQEKWVKGFLLETNWSDVSASWQQCFAVRADGTLWDLSDVTSGNGSGADSGMKRVGAESDWKQISCGAKHVVALKKDGTLWGWGENGNGQLGRPPSNLWFNQPVRIGSESNFVAIQAGAFESQAAKEDGTVWRWSKVGPNTNSVSVLESRDLTSGTQLPSERRIVSWSSSGASTYSIAVRADGTMWAWSSWLAGYPAGTWLPLPVGLVTAEQSRVGARSIVQVGKDSDWQHVTMGQSGQLFAVKRDGSLWWWRFKRRQRTDEVIEPTRLSRHSDWVAVAAGDGWPIAWAAEGSLWQWWANDNLSWLFAPSRRPQKLANVFE